MHISFAGRLLCLFFFNPHPIPFRRPSKISLDASKLEGRHFGEASCRDYRESVLHVLPHMWERPADTRLLEAHFVKHRVGRGAAKGDLAPAAAAAAKGRGALSAL